MWHFLPSRLLQLLTEFKPQIQHYILPQGSAASQVQLLAIDAADTALGLPLMRSQVSSVVRLLSPCQTILACSSITPHLAAEAHAWGTHNPGGRVNSSMWNPESGDQSDPINSIAVIDVPPAVAFSGTTDFQSNANKHTLSDTLMCCEAPVIRSKHRPGILRTLVVPPSDVAGQLYGIIRQYGLTRKQAGHGFKVSQC